MGRYWIIFLPSEIIAAFLWAQLENIKIIQQKRLDIWNFYQDQLKGISLKTQSIPEYSTNNAHMFYLVCNNPDERKQLIQILSNQGIGAVFHYLSPHKSPFYTSKYEGDELKYSDHYSDCLVRLPFFYNLTQEEQQKICLLIRANF